MLAQLFPKTGIDCPQAGTRKKYKPLTRAPAPLPQASAQGRNSIAARLALHGRSPGSLVESWARGPCGHGGAAPAQGDFELAAAAGAAACARGCGLAEGGGVDAVARAGAVASGGQTESRAGGVGWGWSAPRGGCRGRGFAPRYAGSRCPRQLEAQAERRHPTTGPARHSACPGSRTLTTARTCAGTTASSARAHAKRRLDGVRPALAIVPRRFGSSPRIRACPDA